MAIDKEFWARMAAKQEAAVTARALEIQAQITEEMLQSGSSDRDMYTYAVIIRRLARLELADEASLGLR